MVTAFLKDLFQYIVVPNR